MPDLINTQQNKGFGLATGGVGGGVTPQQQAIQQTGLSPVDPPAIEGELLQRAATPAPQERGAFAQGALDVAEGIGDGLIFTGKILAAGVLGTIGGADFSDEILRVGEFSPEKVKKRKQIEGAQIRGAELQNMGRGVDLTIKHISLMKNMRLEDRGPYIESLGDSLTVNGFDHRVALKSAVETGKLEEYEDTLRYLAAKPGITSEMLDLLKTDSSRQNPELLIEFKKNFLDAEVKNVAAVDLAEKKAATLPGELKKARDLAKIEADKQIRVDRAKSENNLTTTNVINVSTSKEETRDISTKAKRAALVAEFEAGTAIRTSTTAPSRSRLIKSDETQRTFIFDEHIQATRPVDFREDPILGAISEEQSPNSLTPDATILLP